MPVTMFPSFDRRVHWRDRVLDLVKPSYFKIFLVYLVCVVLVGSGVLCVCDASLTYIDALSLSASAFAEAGLNVRDLSQVTPQTNVVIGVIMLLGSPVIQTIVPLILRWRLFDATRATRLDLLEYNALRKLVPIVLWYYFGSQLIAFIVLSLWASHDLTTISNLNANRSTVFGWAAFVCISSFQNNGLTPLTNNFMDFYQSPLVLIVIALLCLMGDTMYPIFLRLIVWGKSRFSSGYDRITYKYLLENSRRIYTHMFPSAITMWLLIVVLGVNLIEFIFMAALDWNSEVFGFMNSGEKFMNMLFMVSSTRKVGANTVNIPDLNYGMLTLYLGTMYLSSSPVLAAVRYSNSASTKSSSVYQQARGMLMQDSLFVFALFVFICIAENQNIRQDPVNFSIFAIAFECISGYGTIGMSMGYPGTAASFCSAWNPVSKVFLAVLMILGRLRGFPDANEPAVRIWLLKDSVHSVDDDDDDNRNDDDEDEELISKTPLLGPQHGLGADGRSLNRSRSTVSVSQSNTSASGDGGDIALHSLSSNSSNTSAVAHQHHQHHLHGHGHGHGHGHSQQSVQARYNESSDSNDDDISSRLSHQSRGDRRSPSVISLNEERLGSIPMHASVAPKRTVTFLDDYMWSVPHPQQTLGPIPPANFEICVEVDENINNGAPFVVVRDVPSTATGAGASASSTGTPSGATSVSPSTVNPRPVFPRMGSQADTSATSRPHLSRMDSQTDPVRPEQPPSPSTLPPLITTTVASPTIAASATSPPASLTAPPPPSTQQQPQHLPSSPTPVHRPHSPVVITRTPGGGWKVGDDVESSSSSSDDEKEDDKKQRFKAHPGEHQHRQERRKPNKAASSGSDADDSDDDDPHVVVLDLRRKSSSVVNMTGMQDLQASRHGGPSAAEHDSAEYRPYQQLPQQHADFHPSPAVPNDHEHDHHAPQQHPHHHGAPPLHYRREHAHVPPLAHFDNRPAPMLRSFSHTSTMSYSGPGARSSHHPVVGSISRSPSVHAHLANTDESPFLSTPSPTPPLSAQGSGEHNPFRDDSGNRHGRHRVRLVRDEDASNMMEQQRDVIRNLAPRRHVNPLAFLADLPNTPLPVSPTEASSGAAFHFPPLVLSAPSRSAVPMSSSPPAAQSVSHSPAVSPPVVPTQQQRQRSPSTETYYV